MVEKNLVTERVGDFGIHQLPVDKERALVVCLQALESFAIDISQGIGLSPNGFGAHIGAKRAETARPKGIGHEGEVVHGQRPCALRIHVCP